MFELLGFDIVATSYIRLDWFYTNSMCRKKNLIQQFESFLKFFLKKKIEFLFCFNVI